MNNTKSTPERKNKIKIIESVLVGNVECVEDNGNYYKLIDGEKGELYAVTKNGKVVLYKKSVANK